MRSPRLGGQAAAADGAIGSLVTAGGGDGEIEEILPRSFLCVVSSVALAAVCAIAAPVASAKTVWLCRPGHEPDPCTPGLSTTVYTPGFQQLRVEQPRQVRSPKIDCFYVYPTVSDQVTGNANLHIDPQED